MGRCFGAECTDRHLRVTCFASVVCFIPSLHSFCDCVVSWLSLLRLRYVYFLASWYRGFSCVYSEIIFGCFMFCAIPLSVWCLDVVWIMHASSSVARVSSISFVVGCPRLEQPYVWNLHFDPCYVVLCLLHLIRVFFEVLLYCVVTIPAVHNNMSFETYFEDFLFSGLCFSYRLSTVKKPKKVWKVLRILLFWKADLTSNMRSIRQRCKAMYAIWSISVKSHVKIFHLIRSKHFIFWPFQTLYKQKLEGKDTAALNTPAVKHALQTNKLQSEVSMKWKSVKFVFFVDVEIRTLLFASW